MSDPIERLKRWRDVGDDPDVGYNAGNKAFADDVIAALAEIDRLRLLLKEAGEALAVVDAAAPRLTVPSPEPDYETGEEREAWGLGFARAMWLAAKEGRPVLAKIKAELETAR